MDDVRIEYDRIRAHGDEATLFQIGDEEYWLPHSVCRFYEMKKVVYVPHWLALKKGLI